MERDRLQLKKNLVGFTSLKGPLGESKTFLTNFETLMVQELSVGQEIGNSFKTPREDRDAAD